MAKPARKLIIMDERGRITIPNYMRESLGMGGRCAVWVELYPPHSPRALIIKRGQR